MISYYQKNKHLNQQIRCKVQNRRDIGHYYRNKKDKVKRRNKTKNNQYPWIMHHYVPSAPYPSIDYWEHPMSYHNLTFLHKDLYLQMNATKRNSKNVTIMNTKSKIKYKLERSEKLILLLSGYVHEIYESYSIQIGARAQEIIRKYSWNLISHSQKCITATHLIASVIDEYINDESNKCEFSDNTDFNLLNYIFIRGGALRDCHLMRNMRDIDLTVNIYDLSRAYLIHLTKYHSNHSKKSDSKCVYWQHYLNKYPNKPKNVESRHPNYNYHNDAYNIFCNADNLPFYPTGDADVDKIVRYEYNIVTSNYLLNARFIQNILRKKLKPRLFNIRSAYFDLHYIIEGNIQWKSNRYRDVKIDLVDETSNPDGRYKTFRSYGLLRGGNNTIKNIVSQIDAYNNESKENVCISIPLYPFPMQMDFHDFTINSMHIDLQQVLINNHCANYIDYNWECKIRKKYNNKKINKYNAIGINDLNNKIIRCPLLSVINQETACFYFWRFVKLAQKFIFKIINNTWKIDRKYLKHTIEHYRKWFNQDLFMCSEQTYSCFTKKFLKWNINNTDDYVHRFHVFRYIKFEKYFIASLLQYSIFSTRLTNDINSLPYHFRVQLKRCFNQFGYPPMNIDTGNNNIAHVRYVGSAREFDS